MIALRVLLAGLSPCLLSACVIGQIGAVMHPTVSGELVAYTEDGANAVWKPDGCASGDRDYFLGFDFTSSQNQDALRAIKEPTGSVVVRWTSAHGMHAFRADDCIKLDLDIRPTGWRVNEVREFSGHIDLQCHAADGAAIEGHLSVDHCH